ncbi:MAG TPA: retropepsin-like aspartic protease [Bdellovibrionota bacterium]
MKKAFLALSALFLFCFSAGAGLFSYKDKNGTLHAVTSEDQIPEEYKAKSRKVSSSTESTAPSKDLTLKLEREGNTLLIPVRFGDAGEFLMILDTGAGMTMISKEIAHKVKAKQIGTQEIATASDRLHMPQVVLPEVSVKQFTVRNMAVTVNDLPVRGRAQGLLGLDFLNHFKMSIDSATGQLHLEKK